MPNKTQYTRCPQCETAFKVTEEMLAMANGRVRCGACLEVFIASEHQLKPRKKPVESHDSQQVSSTDTDLKSSCASEKGFSSIEQAQIKAEAFIHENVEETSQGNGKEFSSETLDSEHVTSTSKNKENLFELIDEQTEQTTVEIETETAEEKTDISETDPIIDETESTIELTSSEQESLKLESSRSEFSQSEITEELIEDSEILKKIERIESLDVDDFSVDHLDEDEPDEAAPDFVNTETQDSEHTAIENADSQEMDIEKEFTAEKKDSTEHEDESVAAENTKEIDKSQITQDELGDNDIDGNVNDKGITDEAILDEAIGEQLELAESGELDVLAVNLAEQINKTDVQPDPLEEFEDRVEKKKTSLRTIVIFVSLLTVLTVSFFKFWNNRQELAWDESWGGFTKAVCGVLPCDLKPRRNIAKIKLRQRIVTPSEEQEDQLDIKILMINEAKFEQPYPTIVIGFSNTLGEKVAEKQFTVNDYFPERANQMMPADAEVHIAFSIDLPHPDALGFEFDFR